VTVARTPAAIAGASEQQQQPQPTAARPPVQPGRPRVAAVNPCGCCAETKSSGSLLPAVVPPRWRATARHRTVRLVTPGARRSAAGLRARRTSTQHAHTYAVHARTYAHTLTRLPDSRYRARAHGRASVRGLRLLCNRCRSRNSQARSGPPPE